MTFSESVSLFLSSFYSCQYYQPLISSAYCVPCTLYAIFLVLIFCSHCYHSLIQASPFRTSNFLSSFSLELYSSKFSISLVLFQWILLTLFLIPNSLCLFLTLSILASLAHHNYHHLSHNFSSLFFYQLILLLNTFIHIYNVF